MFLNPFGVLQDFLAHVFHRYGIFVGKHPDAFIIGPILLTGFLSFGCLNVKMSDFLAHVFHRYGIFVGKHPDAFIIGPILLTGFLSFGCLNVKMSDDLRFLYSPEDSPSRFEYQIHQNFSGDSVNSSLVAVALQSSDGNPNMLRKEIAENIRNLNNFIQQNLTLTIDGKTYHFGNDICAKLVLCPISNTPVEIFFDVHFSEKLKNDPRVKIDWPIMKFFENKFFLPTFFYGVEVDEKYGNLTKIELIHLVYHISGIDENDPRVKIDWPIMKFFENKFFLPTFFYGVQVDEKYGNLTKIELIHLVYHISGIDEHPSLEVSRAFENALNEMLNDKKNIFQSAMFSLNILKDEMHKNTTYTFPFIALTMFLLMSFTVGS
uniref:Uncharacterized protein n=1 Tax=Panagrolaimus sp. JU765 TaxID=591449 RepID=A0AC34R1N5_9BILA